MSDQAVTNEDARLQFDEEAIPFTHMVKKAYTYFSETSI